MLALAVNDAVVNFALAVREVVFADSHGGKAAVLTQGPVVSRRLVWKCIHFKNRLGWGKKSQLVVTSFMAERNLRTM